MSHLDSLDFNRKGDDRSMKIKTMWHKYEDCIELVAAVDEYQDEANPDYWEKQCRSSKVGSDPHTEERVITFDIPDSVIENAFEPALIDVKIKVEV